MAILPLIDGRATLREVSRLWGIVYAGNLLGCVLFVGLVVVVGEPMGIAEPSAFRSLADSPLGLPPLVVVTSGVSPAG